MPGVAERAPVVASVVAAADEPFIVLDGAARTMLTPGEVAGLWSVSVRTIYRLIRTGRLPVMNLAPGSRGGAGDKYRISVRALAEVQARRDAPIPTGES